MSAIEALRQRPKITAAVVLLVVLAAVGFAIYSWPASPKASVQSDVPQAFFTTDDGATWFPDTADKLAPFTKDGKEAVRIHLYDAGSGKPPIVGHLERLSPGVIAQINALKGKPNTQYQIADLQQSALEVKRRGDAKWLPIMSPEAAKVRSTPTNPAGDPLPELSP